MTATPPASPVVRDPSPPVAVPGLILPPLHDKLVREGKCRFREVAITVNIDHAFRNSWKRHQQAWLERGFSIRQINGQWRLAQWLLVTPDGLTLTDIGKSTLARLGAPVQQTLNLTEPTRVLELSPLPNGLEAKLRAYQITPARQLYRALMKGRQEWGYPGAVDFSDMGTGKTYSTLAAALATGRQVGVLCPSVGQQGWLRAFTHYGVEPLFISTYEAVRGAWRPHIATVDAQGKFTWAHPQEMVLILDEAQAVRHDGNLTVRCCSAAIRQGIPIIVASATIAVSPLEFRFAGRITGLHRGDDDWPRFLREHGCIETSRGNWKWDRKSHHLHRIHSRLFPFRGCRVRKQDLGEECPETVIEIIPFDMPECARIAQEWNDTNELLGRMAHQLDKRALLAMERKCRMKMWKRCENVLVPHVAKRVRADVADGKSVAVFMNFTECRMELSRLVGTRAGFYGGQNKHQRKHWEKEFQENREHILVSNIGAGGASVSLHDIHGERPRVSYIFPTDDVVKFYQATGRVDRVGGKRVSQQFLPCVKGAMTEEIVHRLRRKMMRIDILNDGARAGEARF